LAPILQPEFLQQLHQQTSSLMSAPLPPIAAPIWPRTLVLDDIVWVKQSADNKKGKGIPYWAPARVTSLPFDKALPTKHADNKFFLQVLIWTHKWKPWTKTFEPTSDAIRMWHQISKEEALAALSPQIQHLITPENLSDGIEFALKWQAHVNIEQRRGRNVLCAGMKVGCYTPGQCSEDEYHADKVLILFVIFLFAAIGSLHLRVFLPLRFIVSYSRVFESFA
jgi:hypothetical protein